MANNFQLKAIISAQDKLSPTLKGIQKTIKITKKSLGDIAGAGRNLMTSIGVGGAAISGGVFAALSKIVSESSKFEKFETVLSTIEGSAEKARASINWIDKFSNDTPYDLDEVTEAYVQLRAYGLDPVAGSLQSVGEAAAGMGKPLLDAVSALKGAVAGNNEALKNSFAIDAKKIGNDTFYKYTDLLTGQTQIVKAAGSTRKSIEAAITGIWNNQFGGSMQKLAKTWDGSLGMLKGYGLNFARWIGSAGIFDSLKDQIQVILDLFAKWESDGTLSKLAKSISADLQSVVKELAGWLKQIDWQATYQGFRTLLRGIRDFISAIGGLKTVFLAIGALSLAGPISSILSIAASISLLGYSVVAISAPLAAIVAAGYLIYKNWNSIAPMLQQTMQSFSGLGESLMQLWGVIGPLMLPVLELMGSILGKLLVVAIKTLTDNIKDMVNTLTFAVDLFRKVTSFVLPDWVKDKLGIARDTPEGSQSGSSPGARLTAANKTKLDGEVLMRFENAPPGFRVDPGKTNQPGMTFNPDVGYRDFVFGY